MPGSRLSQTKVPRAVQRRAAQGWRTETGCGCSQPGLQSQLSCYQPVTPQISSSWSWRP